MRRLVGEDRGSATVVGAWAIAALAVAIAVLMYAGAAIVARHRVQSAADLAALAGALAQLAGDDACTQAAESVRRQQTAARMVHCTIDDDDVTVSVAIDVTLGRWGVREALASARAGPVDQ